MLEGRRGRHADPVLMDADAPPVHRINARTPAGHGAANIGDPIRSSDADPGRTMNQRAFTLYGGEVYVERERFTGAHGSQARGSSQPRGRLSRVEGTRRNRRRIRPSSLGQQTPEEEPS